MKTAIVLMAYGSPERSDQAEPYLHRLLGREPSPELVADLKRRYDVIGGHSPLNNIVQEQAEALSGRLNLPVYAGHRFWGDTIQQAVDQARADGTGRLVGLALTPFESARALGAYRDEFLAAAGATPHAMADPWPTEPHWIKYWVELIPTNSTVLFTAHSLPIAGSESYMGGLNACINAIVSLAAVEPRLAFQSRPPSPGQWLSPTVEEILPTLPKGEVLVAPIGFLCDHLEILYDLDFLHRRQAESLGLKWTRLPMPNAKPLLIEALVTAAKEAVKRAGWDL